MSLKSMFKPVGWLFVKAWWLLDGTRRALMNLLLLLVLVILVIAFVTRGPQPLQEKTALVLNLQGALVEQYSGSARSQLIARLRGSDPEPGQVRLRDVLRVLDAAAEDERIWALLLDVDELQRAGLAGLHEVAAGIQRFKASGKPVLAYGDGYSQRAYFLAAQASEIYLNPMGSVDLTGFGGYRSYYKDAFDRLGVSANVLRVGAYKNAAEPYFANGPSKATQEADAALYGELWSRFTGAIETARKLPAGSISAGIEALPRQLEALKGDAAALALQGKLVDGIKTRDEMRALLMERGAKDAEGKSFRAVSTGEYLRHVKPPRSDPAQPGRIGVVVAEGPIVDGDAGPGRVGGDSTARLIRQAREDEQIKAVVLRVNSPGGSAFASEIVRRELALTREAGKPVVVSMGDVAASGGYWISMASDRVFADAGTITGSIGVFGMLPTADKLLDKLSIHTAGTTTTWLAGGHDPRRPLDPRLAAVVQLGIDNVYTQFTTRAAEARKKSVAEIDAVAQGRVWTGSQALAHGLVDELGGMGDAIKAAARLAQLEGEPRLSYIERERSRSERLLESLADIAAPVLGDVMAGLMPPAVLTDAMQELAWLTQMGERARAGGQVPAYVHCLCLAP